MSYSIPKGVQRGPEIDLSDQTYDGVVAGDRLVNGLGQLVDGAKGSDNFRSDIHGFGKGKRRQEGNEVEHSKGPPPTLSINRMEFEITCPLSAIRSGLVGGSGW